MDIIEVTKIAVELNIPTEDRQKWIDKQRKNLRDDHAEWRSKEAEKRIYDESRRTYEADQNEKDRQHEANRLQHEAKWIHHKTAMASQHEIYNQED